MAQLSALRTRLQRRLGLGVVSGVEADRLDEALNSGIARALSDGVPGLADTFVGSVPGTLTMGTADVTADSTSVVFTGISATALTTTVMPNDILVVDVAGAKTKFLIHNVVDGTHVDIGVPASVSLSGGGASVIERRSLILPSTGQVVSIQPESGNRGEGLAREPDVAKRNPFATGTARFFEQHYIDSTPLTSPATSFASLWPAPTDNTAQFVVSQSQFNTRLTADADDLPFPEEVLDAILERARDCYMVWGGAANQNDITASYRAIRDSSDALKNSSNPKQIYYKT